MQETSGASLGNAIGWLALFCGVALVGLGLAYLFRGEKVEGVDGLLFGGLAFIAGYVIIIRRRKVKS